jgi:hypothetical protein
MPTQGKYTDEEVRKILDIALRGEPDRGVTHDELVAIASEVGVSREAIDAAARQVQRDGGSEAVRRHILRKRRGHLVSHAFVFAVVNAFLFVVNYLSTPGQWWVLFPVFIWGLVLTFHARFALSREVSAKALLEQQRRAALEKRHADWIERTELAALEESSRSPNAQSATPRTRIAAIPPLSESDAATEPQAETEIPSTELGRHHK